MKRALIAVVASDLISIMIGIDLLKEYGFKIWCLPLLVTCWLQTIIVLCKIINSKELK